MNDVIYEQFLKILFRKVTHKVIPKIDKLFLFVSQAPIFFFLKRHIIYKRPILLDHAFTLLLTSPNKHIYFYFSASHLDVSHFK